MGAAMPNPMAAMQQQAMMTALLQQQAAVTRRARQLHVGNLPPGLTGEEPEELFKTMMQVMHSLLPSAAALGRCFSNQHALARVRCSRPPNHGMPRHASSP